MNRPHSTYSYNMHVVTGKGKECTVYTDSTDLRKDRGYIEGIFSAFCLLTGIR